MKYLKKFEKVKGIEGDIITVSTEEFDLLQEEDFDIRWDDEIDYEENSFGQWRFMDDEREEIEEQLLEIYRNTKNSSLPKDIKKYNL